MRPGGAAIDSGARDKTLGVIGLAVSGYRIIIPRRAAVLSTTGSINVRVPALYCLHSLGRVNNYHIYIIRIRNYSRLITTYGGCILSNVIVRAGDPGTHRTHHAGIRLLLSRRSSHYADYIHDNGYGLRAVTGSLNVFCLPCRGRLANRN